MLIYIYCTCINMYIYYCIINIFPLSCCWFVMLLNGVYLFSGDLLILP